MKNFRKIVACAMAMCTLSTVCVVNVSADEINSDNNAIINSNSPISGLCGENVKYKFDAETATITLSGTGSTYDYYCDGTYTKVPWISYQDDIRNVVIESGITGIGNNIFSNCTLKSVVFPDTLKNIGSIAFSNCSLTEIKFPESLETIGSGAFSDNLFTELIIPEGVSQIDYGVFQNCKQLQSLTIPSTLKRTGDLTFYKCEALKNVTINEGVEIIGSNSFSDCTSLTEIVIPNGVKEIDSNSFYNCSSLNNVTLPDTLETIDWGAFEYCTSLENIVIPDNVISVDSSSFNNTPMEESQIENDLIYIDKWIVNCKRDAGNIELRPDTAGIADSAFFSNSAIKSITIPASVKAIDESAFYDSRSLTDVIIENPDCIICDWQSTFSNYWDKVQGNHEGYPTKDGVYYIDMEVNSFSGTIHGYENSTAQAYAEKYGYRFEAIDSDTVIEHKLPEYDVYFNTCVTIKNDDDFTNFLYDAISKDTSDKNYRIITINDLGNDKDGNKVLSHNPNHVVKSYNDEGNPVIINYGCHEICKTLGFDTDGEVITGGESDELVRIDDNGIPEIVKYEQLSYNGEYSIIQTINLDTGDDMFVKYSGNRYGTIINRGDATSDGEVDIRDITAFNQSIVKMNEIPDYLNSIADIDSDGEIGIKDLGLLKKFIVKTIDTL